MKIKDLLWEIFFPKFCLSCKKEGAFLCPDCKATIDIFSYHKVEKNKYLDDIFFAVNYNQPLVQFLIKKFKYDPLIKELAKELSGLIFDHFSLLEEKYDFSNFIIVPIPSEKRKLKQRGFNPAQEIAKEISLFFNLPLVTNVLIKIKNTLPQANLKKEQRRENIKDAFDVLASEKEKMTTKNILLVDDVFTTGATMEEAAKVLKMAGAKKIVGVVLAREF